VTTTLVLAEQHCCEELKEACLALLLSPGVLSEVMGTDEDMHLKRSCPSLVDELLAELAPKRLRT
jgi:speckle-type POZ protein